MRSYSARCIARLKELGAPLSGWECVRVEDLEEACFTCELCDYESIRYVHHMKHSDWPNRFRVGCVCDGTMSLDMLGAEMRDRKAQNKSARWARFIKKQWKQTADDVYTLEKTSGRIKAKRDSFYGEDYYKVTVGGEQYQWRNNRRIADLYEAKLFAFDILEYEKQSDNCDRTYTHIGEISYV